MPSSMYQVGGVEFAQRTSLAHFHKRSKRAPLCFAKGKKNRNKQNKNFPGDSVPSMPDTASLHLQYANMLGIAPEVAMKRVLEGASTSPCPPHNYVN